MVIDTTQFLIERNLKRKKEEKKQGFSKLDFGNVVPLVKDSTGVWTDPSAQQAKITSKDLQGKFIRIETRPEDRYPAKAQPNIIKASSLSIPEYALAKWKQSKAAAIRPMFVDSFFRGKITIEEMLEQGDFEFNKRLEEDGILENAAFFTLKRIVGAFTEFLPSVMGGIEEAAKNALMLGTLGGVIGFLSGGGVGAVPGMGMGIAVGIPFGIIKYSLENEGYSLFFDLVSDGADPKIAYIISQGVGVAIGIIETFQLGRFTKGFRKLAVKAYKNKKVQSILLEAMKLHLKDTGFETGQEFAQEILQIGGRYLDFLIEGNENVLPTVEEMLEQARDMAFDVPVASFLLSAPGSTVRGFKLRTQKKFEKIKKEVEGLNKEIEKLGEEEITITIAKPEEKVEAKKEQVTKVEKAEVKEVVTELKGLAEGIIPLSTEIKIKRKDISGRINKLDTEIKLIDNETIPALQKQKEEAAKAARKTIDVEIKNIEKEIKLARVAGKKTKTEALERRLDKKRVEIIKISTEKFDKAIEQKLAERDILDEERAGLLIAEDLSKVDVSGKRVELSANEVKEMQTLIVKSKIKNIQSGIKKGKQIARAEIRDIQNTLTSIILASEINETQKKLALRSIQKIQTTKQFEKAIPVLLGRLSEASETFKKRKLIDSFKKMTKSKVIDKLSPDIKKAVQSELDMFTATKPSKKTTEGLDAIAKELAEHPNNMFPKEQLSLLPTLLKKPLSELPLSDVQLIHDAIAHLLKLNEQEGKIRVGNVEKETEKVSIEAANNVRQRFGLGDETTASFDSLQRAKEAGLLKKFTGVESTNVEFISQTLDGEDGGIIQQIMYKGLDDGSARELAYKHLSEDFFIEKGFRDLVKRDWSVVFKKKVRKKHQVKVQLSSGELKLTKADRVSLLLHMRNENSVRHLTEGGFVFRLKPEADPIVLTENDLIEIRNSATKEEKQVADAIHEYFNTIQKQALNKISVKLLGFEIANELNYFPIHVNLLTLEREIDFSVFNDPTKFIQFTLEGMGIFKQRSKSSAPIIISDAFQVTRQNMDKAAAYIGLAEPLRSAKALLNSKKFQISMREAGLKHHLEAMQTYLRNIEGNLVRTDNSDKLTQDWFNKLDVAILGGNPYIWMKQPVSYLLAATEMDLKYIATSFKMSISKTELAEIMKWSPHFRDRFEGNISREAGEVAQVGRDLKFFLGIEVMSNNYMKPLRKFDKAAIGSIWRATKKEVKDKHPSLKGDDFFKKVAERSWEVARRTQPTFAIKDRSIVGMSRNKWLRGLTKYSSQRNKNWIMTRRAFEEFKQDGDKAKFIKRIILLRLVAPAMIAAINTLAFIGAKAVFKGDDKEDQEELFRKFFFDWLITTLGDIYLFSPAIGSGIKLIAEGRNFSFQDPVSSNIDLMIRTAADIFKTVELAITGEEFIGGKRDGEKKWVEKFGKAFSETLDVSMKVKGLPFNGYIKFLRVTKRQLERIFTDFENNDSNKLRVDRF